MSGWTWWWLWEVLAVREVLSEVAGDLGEGLELGVGDWAQHHFITMFLNEHLRAWESESLGQTHGLAAAVLKYLCCSHSYGLYPYRKQPQAACTSLSLSSSIAN